MWLGVLLEATALVGGSACNSVQGEYQWATDVADSDCGVAAGGAGRRRRGRGSRQQLLAEQAPCGKSTIARLGGVDGCQGGDAREHQQRQPRVGMTWIRAVGAAWRREHRKGAGNVAASIA